MMLEPRSSGDRDKLRSALQRLEHEDPTLGVCEDEETGQWEVAGMGELHLEVVLHRLESEHRVEVGRGQPRVAYREAPRRAGCGSKSRRGGGAWRMGGFPGRRRYVGAVGDGAQTRVVPALPGCRFPVRGVPAFQQRRRACRARR